MSQSHQNQHQQERRARGRSQARCIDLTTEAEPSASPHGSFPLLTSLTLRGHTLAYFCPSTEVVVQQWRNLISINPSVNPEHIPPLYPSGWPEGYLPRLNSPPPPRPQPGYMATTTSVRAKMNITAADIMAAREEARRRAEDARSEKYVFDGAFQEEWMEGMRQAAVRKKMLASSPVALPFNSYDTAREDVSPKAKAKEERTYVRGEAKENVRGWIKCSENF